ncbi:MAG: hypothetical protein ACO3K3_00945 [Schleiferiaceae bacterium]
MNLTTAVEEVRAILITGEAADIIDLTGEVNAAILITGEAADIIDLTGEVNAAASRRRRRNVGIIDLTGIPDDDEGGAVPLGISANIIDLTGIPDDDEGGASLLRRNPGRAARPRPGSLYESDMFDIEDIVFELPLTLPVVRRWTYGEGKDETKSSVLRAARDTPQHAAAA